MSTTRTANTMPASQSDELQTPRKFSLGLDKIFLLLVMLYLIIPLATTLAFGLSNGKTLDFSTYPRIFTDHDFTDTLTRSLGISLTATVLSILLVTPTAYWVQMRLPRVRPVMDFLALVPFAVPAIIMALGLAEVYGTPNTLVSILSFGLVPLLSNPPFNILNTAPLLVCAYVIISLPFVYRPIDNNLRAINTRVLTEAAYSLGSGWWRTFLTIILPNILPGVISAALLTFSTAMGEFTLASLFSIYTFPIYLNVTGQNDAHKAASLAILSFMLTLICVLGIIFFVRLRPNRAQEEDKLDIVAAK
jgi:putative spermidine/putrescine transport system permease protein